MADSSKACEQHKLEKYQLSSQSSDEMMRNIRFANDDLRRQLYMLSNRFLTIAEKLGYSSIDDLEECAFAADYEPLSNLRADEASKRSHAIGRTVLSHAENTCASSKEELLQCKKGHEPQHLCEADCKHSERYESSFSGGRRDVERNSITHLDDLQPLQSSIVSPAQQELLIRKQLESLSRKYDALLTSKMRAEHKYKEDYKKWRSFKKWLTTKSKHAGSLRGQLQQDLSLQLKLDSMLEGDEMSFLDDRSHMEEAMSSPSSRDAKSRKTVKLRTRCASPGTRNPETSEERGQQKEPSAYTSPREQDTLRLSPNVVGCSTPKRRRSNTLLSPSRDMALLAHEASASRGHPCRNNETINALFKIDTARNGGLSFQFDDVVRKRKDRKRLEAADCDCCKMYYDNVGPLPEPLLPPTWSSPKRDIRDHARKIDSGLHKKRISRHRHQWTPPKTPPGYWDIGFPTTQEAVDINKKAESMHAEKRKRVELEAGTGGRYTRRDEQRRT